MDSQLRVRLAWTAALVFFALSGAGLAVAADRPHVSADQQAMPLMQSLADELAALDALAIGLADSGLLTVGRLQGLDVEGMRTAVADGDALSGELGAAVEKVSRARAAMVENVDPAHLGIESAAVFTVLTDASGFVDGLADEWAALSADAGRMAALLDALEEHDATVFGATVAGRQSRWEDALRLLDDAEATIADAVHVRNQLATNGDVATLDDLLARYRTYDAALRALYEFMQGGGAQSGARFVELQGTVDSEQAALPAETSALSVIVADAGSTPMTRRVAAIETTRGQFRDAIAAMDALNGDGQ